MDLLWGVPTKDTDGETANCWVYCRQWIDRVEPFFVGFLAIQLHVLREHFANWQVTKENA